MRPAFCRMLKLWYCTKTTQEPDLFGLTTKEKPRSGRSPHTINDFVHIVEMKWMLIAILEYHT